MPKLRLGNLWCQHLFHQNLWRKWLTVLPVGAASERGATVLWVFLVYPSGNRECYRYAFAQHYQWVT